MLPTTSHSGSIHWRAILTAFALSRLLFLAVTLIVAAINLHSPLTLWYQLDTQWYLGIARHGYAWTLDGKPTLAFFPLYPLLIHVVAWVVPPLVASLLIANAAFLGALIYFHRLVRLDFGERTASAAVMVLAFFPTALFTAAPYSESLFLLAACGCLFHAHRQQPVTAGLWLAAALLTRSTGLILVLPLVILVRPRTVGDLARLLLPTIVGWSAYLIYLRSHHLPWITLLHAQRAWHRQLSPPWEGFTASAAWLLQHGAAHPAFALEDVLQLACTLIGLAVTLKAWPHMSTAYRAYAVGFWFLVLLNPEVLDGSYMPFGSMDRFLLTLLPAIIWLAMKSAGRGFRPALAMSSLLLAAATAVHLSGGWVG